MVTIKSNTLDQLSIYTAELVELTSKPGNLTKKEEQRHAALLAAISALKAGADPREVRHWDEDRLLREAGLSRRPERARTRLGEEVENEWRCFMRGDAVRKTSIPPDREIRASEAGQQSINFAQGSAGGYFVPQGFHDRAMQTMQQADQIFDERFSNVIETDTGANLPCPSFDDVSVSSVQVGETVQSPQVDVANFGQTQLNAYSFRSQVIALSLELLEDIAFPLGPIMELIMAGRHARGAGKALITGTGVASPTGLLTATLASGAIPVVATGSATNTGGSETGSTSVGTKDLTTLYAKLDPAYRAGAAFYMNDSTLIYLMGLLDKMGRPIVSFRKGLTDLYADKPCLLGKNVCVCPSMPSISNSANPIIFGNPQYFFQRRVPSASYVRRFWESPLLITSGLVGFASYFRVDSELSAPNPSYLPMAVLQCHS